MKDLLVILLIVMFISCSSLIQKKPVISMQWKIAGQIPANSGQTRQIGIAGPIAGFHNDIMIVAGGSNFPGSMPWLGGKKAYYNDLFSFKKIGDSLISTTLVQRLPYKVAYSANCSTSEGIVCVGGENEDGIINKVLLIQCNESNGEVNFRQLPDLPIAVSNASLANFGDVVYLIGGESTPAVSNNFFSLDLKNTKQGWKQLPSMPMAISHAVATIQSNGNNECLYVMGGRRKNIHGVSDLFSNVFEFDMQANVWKQKTPLPYPLSAGTGISAGNHQILLFGGDRGETFHKAELIIDSINHTQDSMLKAALIQEKTVVQSSHPGFDKTILVYDTQQDKWSSISMIPFECPVTTTAVRWKDRVYIPGGEIRAGVRTPHILEGILVR
jgi:cyclically-permuted mutarotase family protein